MLAWANQDIWPNSEVIREFTLYGVKLHLIGESLRYYCTWDDNLSAAARKFAGPSAQGVLSLVWIVGVY